ncbi:MAG: EamA family transporter [Candidatus Cloacimonadota bacterium]|nr:MAG: EamA family transporter [Candidatus Cloacimonadota bacterium]
MKIWLVYATLCTFMWGLWGFLGKMASRSVTSKNLILLGVLGGLIIYPLYFLLFHKHFTFSWKNPDFYFAVIGGILGSLGAIFFYLALSKGEASRVVVTTAMYPVLTVLLSFLILREGISLSKIVGIVFALAGIFFLSR